MIENEIDHEIANSSVVISSGLSESPYADYDFMIVPTESSSSESSELFVMIQQVIFSTFFY